MSAFSKISNAPPRARTLFAGGVGLLMLIAHMRRKARESDHSTAGGGAGDDEDDISSLVRHKIGSGDKVAVNAQFLGNLRRLLRIVVPSWRSKEAALLGAQLCCLCLRTVFSIMTAELDGIIVGFMVRKQREQFTNLISWFLLAAFPTTFVNSMIRYLQREIELRFRTRLNTVRL